jgi:hypothetical protein
VSAEALPDSYWDFQRTLALFFQVSTVDVSDSGTLLSGTLLSDKGDGTVDCLAENVALPLTVTEWRAVLDSRCEEHRDSPVGFGSEIELILTVRG